jgi:hypothetical protein
MKHIQTLILASTILAFCYLAGYSQSYVELKYKPKVHKDYGKEVHLIMLPKKTTAKLFQPKNELERLNILRSIFDVPNPEKAIAELKLVLGQ